MLFLPCSSTRTRRWESYGTEASGSRSSARSGEMGLSRPEPIALARRGSDHRPVRRGSAAGPGRTVGPGCGVTNVSLLGGRESAGEGLTDTDGYQILAGIRYRSVS